MAIRWAVLCALFCVAGGLCVSAQNLKGYYVSKAEEDGVIYHTFPTTLFESKPYGDLTFDITYKEHRDGLATVNFTYELPQAVPADSVRLGEGKTAMVCPAEKIYIEPDKKAWKHRYSFRVELTRLGAFFDADAAPEVVVYSAGKSYIYRVKPSPWRTYAPVGYKIIDMIRVNEAN